MQRPYPHPKSSLEHLANWGTLLSEEGFARFLKEAQKAGADTKEGEEMYATLIELGVVKSLVGAALEGNTRLAQVEAEVRQRLSQVALRPVPFARFPNLAPVARTLLLSLPALAGGLRHYLAGDFTADPDALLSRAAEAKSADEARALVERAGAAILYGAQFRDSWGAILEGEVGLALSLFLVAAVGLPSAPDFFFPLGEPAEAIARWRGLEEGWLHVFRPRERGREEETLPPRERRLLDALGQPGYHPAQDTAAWQEAAPRLAPVLLDVLSDLRYRRFHTPGLSLLPVGAARALGVMQEERAILPLVQICSTEEPFASLWYAAVEALEKMGKQAELALLDLLRHGRGAGALAAALLALPPGAATEADLKHAERQIRRLPWRSGKSQTAVALSRLALSRSVALVRGLLEEGPTPPSEDLFFLRRCLLSLEESQKKAGEKGRGRKTKETLFQAGSEKTF